MAKKQKEKCPYCGKEFVYLSRHKCKNAPKEEKSKEQIETISKKLEHYIEPKKVIDKESILAKIDLESEAHLTDLDNFLF